MSQDDKTSRDIRQTPKQKEALRLSHQVGRGLGHGDTTTLAEAFCELWDELDIAYACAESSLAPCGHDERYCYTEDGGKNITCLLCEYKARSADRAQVEFRTADLPCKEPKIVYDGREVETPSSALPQEGATPRCDALTRNALDSNDLSAWYSLACRLEKELNASRSATSAQLLEALRVALGESSSMTLPEVRALLARSEGRDA